MAIAADRGKRWTAADLQTIPDDRNRYEIIDGELFVTPAPLWAHQLICQEFFLRMEPYISAYKIGRMIWAPADVQFADSTVIQPDLFVVPYVGSQTPHSWDQVRRLLLVIEVLSTGTARIDRGVKRRLYQREGVPEYWIVDGPSRRVERWRPGNERPEVLTSALEWQPDAGLPPLLIDLPAVFASVFDE